MLAKNFVKKDKESATNSILSISMRKNSNLKKDDTKKIINTEIIIS